MKKEKLHIRLNNLRYSINDKVILKDICLKIESGCFCSIIGPNGSGKTTLLKNISTIYKPDRESIYIGEKDVTDITPKELGKNISFVKQQVDSEFDFIVMDMVLMGRNPHINRFSKESKRDIEIVEQAMKLTNVFHLKDENIKCLSGGEKQRVMIARAIAQQGKIILLDEPTSHLDIFHQLEILDSIKRINNEYGVTVVSVLHDLNLAAQYSDYLIMVNNGKIAAYGRPEQVLKSNLLKEIYKVDMMILEHPVTKKPLIVPISVSL
ncbi:MAG: ABC transporter ATP-binding protein [Bacillota bacterium]|nr:ABC transporter ATP-binding protein [Bacillota bacterium]